MSEDIMLESAEYLELPLGMYKKKIKCFFSLSKMCRTIGPDQQFLVRTGKILSMPDRLTGNNFP
jgi:hypothetical protein